MVILVQPLYHQHKTQTDGVGIFEYTPPTNYRALCTKSINAQEYS